MNIAVRLLQWYTPTFVKKWALHDLFMATAVAFDCPAPPHKRLSYHDCLRLFAQFTQSQVAAVIRDGRDLAAVEGRLYENAFQLGKKYARVVPIRNQAEMRVIGRLLYSILDIDFQSNAQGEVVIRRCYFSHFYTGPICRVMSAMDRGLFAGLSDGGQLRFTTRITEGSPCCLARFILQATALPHPPAPSPGRLYAQERGSQRVRPKGLVALPSSETAISFQKRGQG